MVTKWSDTKQIKISSTVTASQVTANLKQMTIQLGHLARIKLMYINGKSPTTTFLDLGFDQDPGEGMPIRLHHDVGKYISKQYPNGLDIEVQDFFFWMRSHLTVGGTAYFMVGFKTVVERGS